MTQSQTLYRLRHLATHGFDSEYCYHVTCSMEMMRPGSAYLFS